MVVPEHTAAYREIRMTRPSWWRLMMESNWSSDTYPGPLNVRGKTQKLPRLISNRATSLMVKHENKVSFFPTLDVLDFFWHETARGLKSALCLSRSERWSFTCFRWYRYLYFILLARLNASGDITELGTACNTARYHYCMSRLKQSSDAGKINIVE